MKDKRRNSRRGITRNEKIVIIIAGVLVVASMGSLAVRLYQRTISQGSQRREYEGRVMDKWVNYHESEQGTFVGRHLLIKSKNGEVFRVSVSPEIYEQAKPDMWVINDKQGIRLFDKEP